MTNKEFRSDLAKEMRDKYDERNEQLEQIDKLPLTEPVKESAKKEIMDNFYKEMDEMKTRPWFEEARKTHLEEIKARIKLAKSKQEKERLQKEYEEKLAKADEDIAESTKGYEDAQIAHRGKIEDDWNVSENWEIPQDLKDYRQAWQEKIKNIISDVKEKITKAAEKIKVNVETEDDWSRLIEFELWWKKWKILDSKLNSHTNQGADYVHHADYYDSITNIKKDYVRFRWMKWDNVDNWKNKELANYVKEKQWEWLHIPSENEMKKLLAELGKEINSDELSYQVAMLMYLTGMDWRYWLSMRDSSARSALVCGDANRVFSCNDNGNHNASLCMIACE